MSDTYRHLVSHEIDAILDCLSAALSSYRVMEEYEYRNAAALTVPSVTVGVKAIRHDDCWLDKVAGYDGATAIFGVMCEVDFAVTVHCPLAEGGSTGRWLQSLVADLLMGSATLGFVALKAEDITYDRLRRCLCLPLVATGRYVR